MYEARDEGDASGARERDARTMGRDALSRRWTTAARTTAWIMIGLITLDRARADVDVDAVDARARARMTIGFFDDARASEGAMRFTHDANVERDSEDGVSSEGKGNPGMIYARAFDESGGSGFRLGAEDAVVTRMLAPPAAARYWSWSVYCSMRGSRVVSAIAGWPINSANVVADEDGWIVLVATRSMEAFEAVREAYAESGFAPEAVNLSPLFGEVRYGSTFGEADLLSVSFRVAYWPSANSSIVGAEDALGEWATREWPVTFARRRRAARSARIPVTQIESPPPAVAPPDIEVASSAYATVPHPEILVGGGFSRSVGRTILVPVIASPTRCMYDPFYSPWSAYGVRTRSACFGSTSDALYSVSDNFIRRRELTAEWLVVVAGVDIVSTRRATFSNIALYATGGAISSAFSARDVHILAAIDDRSFVLRASTFAVAFGSSRSACRRVSVPCVVARPCPPTASLFIIARDYLDPRTATAPESRPDIEVRVYAL